MVIYSYYHYNNLLTKAYKEGKTLYYLGVYRCSLSLKSDFKRNNICLRSAVLRHCWTDLCIFSQNRSVRQYYFSELF